MNLKNVLLAAGISMMCLAAGTSPGAIIFSNLVSFTGDGGAYPGAAPYCGLTLGADGNFYGATEAGGSYNLGTLFRLTSGGAFQTLVTFNGTNGANPYGGLTLNADGHLYGTTFAGGLSNWGTIFQLTAKGQLVTLYSFTNAAQGANPGSALVADGSGNLYGTTEAGGLTNLLYAYNGPPVASGYGTIFEWTTNGTLNVPFVFGGANGAHPTGGLLLGKDGAFYGTTTFGGPGLTTNAPGLGAIFRLGADGSFSNLHTFSGSDGVYIYAGLAQGPDGYLYSAAFEGGGYGYGTLFKISTNGYVPPPSPVYNFTVYDCGTPYAGMVEGSDGNLYGTTYGAFSPYGSVFRLRPDGAYTNLFYFNKSNGANPAGVLLQGPDNNFYGTTLAGGASNDGAIFRLSIPLPPVIQGMTESNGSATVSWSAVVGQTNQVLYATSLGQGNWTNLTAPFVVTNGFMTFTDANAANSPQGFYRVVLWP